MSIEPLMPGQPTKTVLVYRPGDGWRPDGEPQECLEASLGYALGNGFRLFKSPESTAAAQPTITPDETDADRDEINRIMSGADDANLPSIGSDNSSAIEGDGGIPAAPEARTRPPGRRGPTPKGGW